MTQAGDRSENMQFEYVEGQARAAFPTLLAWFQQQSDALVACGAGQLDLRYGPHERQRFDFFEADAKAGAARATLLYFHAGYWHLRDKSLFRFIAPSFTRRGLNVALVNYPLCPSVSVAELVQAARASVPAVRSHVNASGRAESPLIAAGHSAGAQIAVELALSPVDAAAGAREPPQPIAGLLGISGVYDLEPLVGTSLNQKLRLDAASARAASPLHRAAPACPALFAVGGAETPAFVRQSSAMHEAWRAAGNGSRFLVAPDEDHFSILQTVVAENGPVSDAFDELLRQALRCPGV